MLDPGCEQRYYVAGEFGRQCPVRLRVEFFWLIMSYATAFSRKLLRIMIKAIHRTSIVLIDECILEKPMRFNLAILLIAFTTSATLCRTACGQTPDDLLISPSRPVPTGKAPAMQVKLVKDTSGEKVYAVIFYKGDEILSGMTDFAIRNKIEDAHFTGIGAISGATLAWLDPAKKIYHRIPVAEQVEVLSLIGDIATFNGKPIVHMHAVLGRPNGSTVGGHVFELNVNPTVEVFMTVNTTPLKKKPDDASGMKVIDPKQ
jgi:predicted DNA-binding protein with PD1-like motif